MVKRMTEGLVGTVSFESIEGKVQPSRYVCPHPKVKQKIYRQMNANKNKIN